MLSPRMSTLGLKIKIVPFLISLSEGRIPPKGTEKPGPLTAFLTSRITVGYFSMVFLIFLFFAVEKATAVASSPEPVQLPGRDEREGEREEASKSSKKGERGRDPSPGGTAR